MDNVGGVVHVDVVGSAEDLFIDLVECRVPREEGIQPTLIVDKSRMRRIYNVDGVYSYSHNGEDDEDMAACLGCLKE